MLQQKYNDSEVSAHYRSLTTVTPPAIMDQYTSDTPTGWWNQMMVVFRRSFFYKLREPSAVLTQFVNAVVLSIIIGLIYWQMNRGQAALLVCSALSPCCRPVAALLLPCCRPVPPCCHDALLP